MASSIAIKIEGYEELTQRILAIPNAIRGKVVRPALRAGAKVVAIRAKATSYSRRLRGAQWKVRAIRRSRTKTGYQVVSPPREALGLTGRGYFPAHQDLGWKPGPAAQGPLLPVVKPLTVTYQGKYGTVTRRVKQGLNKREVLAEVNSSRRKIPGRWTFRKALMGAPGMVFGEIARAAAEKMATLKIDVGGASSLNDFEEGGA